MSALTDHAILAVASPPGRSPRAIIRCSGPALGDLIEALFDEPLAPRRLTATPMRLTPSPFQGEGRGEGETSVTSDARHAGKSQRSDPHPSPLPQRERGPVLPVLAVYFRGPHSYTGQDILEIQCPGNPALLEQVRQTILVAASSADIQMRLAEPGEFTRRAYFAGRIDLTQAEGIAATIAAVSDAQLAAANLLRTGKLGSWADDLTDQLADLLALVEAGIDFTDQEDVVPITPAKLHDRLTALIRQLEQLLADSRDWRQLETLPGVVLVGTPNVGKSSLFNALLGRERAVTSDIPGTTRDALAEPLQWRDAHGRTVEAMLIDIAGLEDPRNENPSARLLEQAGSPQLHAAMQLAAHDAIARAELILSLTDDRRGQFIAPVPPDRTLRIGTKSDRITHHNVDLAVSARTGQGLDALRRLIAERLADRAVALAGETLALRQRHLEAIRDALAALSESQRMLVPQRDARALADMELIAAMMRQALDALGRITGRISPDEVIGRVFATFCVGK
ncbi:MAG: tRNA modification GTPase [Phycisphaerales bacterium]